MISNLEQCDLFSISDGVGKVSKISDAKIRRIVEKCSKAFKILEELSLQDRVIALNGIREELSKHSPFSGEPVDFVKWVPFDTVQANDYNPNSVAPPEMELLRLSILADGYTQPIVTNADSEDAYEVIDGFHRNRVGKECEDVRERVQGYLPIVQIKLSQSDKGDRMASTIRHNRARGKHRIEAMSEIVLELKRRNWSSEKIGKNLGMDPDEVLRLAQITGLAEMFADREFSQAWEPASINEDDNLLIDGEDGEENISSL
jgi:ParB-like chromosome segregation protein Spo0J